MPNAIPHLSFFNWLPNREEMATTTAVKQEQPISDLRHDTVRACCSLAEQVLLGDEKEEHRTNDCWDSNLIQQVLRTHQHSSPKDDVVIDWDMIPRSLQPASGQLNPQRAFKKRQQIEALLKEVIPMVDYLYRSKNHPIRVVEFGAGTGHLGLVLAYLRRHQCHVTLVERKEYACYQAQQRVEGVLDNVRIENKPIHQLKDTVPFDLAISLHSCGVLTDAALCLCIQNRAAFVLCPCCYGQTASNLPFKYLPRCRRLESLHSLSVPAATDTYNKSLSSKERRRHRKLKNSLPFYLIAQSADCTSAVKQDESYSKNFLLAKKCMQVVDADRLFWMEQHGFTDIGISSLLPLSVSPKNNIITGMPPSKENAVDLTDWTALQASKKETLEAEAGERKKKEAEQDVN